MTLNLRELLQAVSVGLSDASKKPNNLNYTPNPGGQEEFHKSTAMGRLLAGDNRSGKSIGGVNEAIWRLRGRHPYQKVPEPPVYGRVITVDFDYGADQIIEPLLRQWLPPSELVNSSFEDSYNRRKHVLKLRNGSQLEIKAHGQALESFAGVPRHFVWCDEEPPKNIFIESKTRLIDYNGCFFITMTPVEGLTWVHTDLIEKDPHNVKYFKIRIKDNPHISPEAIEILSSDLDEEDRQIRLGGGDNFVPKGGLVLREFDYSRHVIENDGLPPNFWSIYASVDHGYNNPTAWLWHAVSPDGIVITFMEHYKRLWTIKMHADRVKEVNKELDLQVVLNIGDPSMSQRSGITGTSPLTEYRNEGIPVVPGKKDVDGRLNKMNEYFRQNRWFITQRCPNLLKEIRKYRRKIYTSGKIADLNNLREEPQKKDDHAVDSSGYFFGFAPDIMPLAPPREGIPELVAYSQSRQFPWRVDNQLVVAPTQYTDLGFGECI